MEIFANLFDILDGLLEINVAVVAYHRDDVGSVNFGLSIGVAADAVDLLSPCIASPYEVLHLGVLAASNR